MSKTFEQRKRDNEEYGPKVQALLARHGMSGHPDPGGAEVTHPKFGKLRLSAFDEKDDYETILAFLNRHGVEP